MKKGNFYFWILAIIAVISLACNFLVQMVNPAEQKSSPAEQTMEPLPPMMATEGYLPEGGEQAPAQLPPVQGEGSMALIRQWASEALASSSYGTDSWAAFQATGAPDTPECGDYYTAWASSNSDTQEWLILYYPQIVYAVEVNIVQTYHPDQVVSVDLIDIDGNFINVYTAQPRVIENPCPYALSIPTAFSGVLAQGVRIHIDQSILNIGWNEIDAVELVGAPGEGTPTRPTIP